MWVPNRWEVKFWPPVRYLPVGWWHFVKSFWACWMMLDRNWSGYSLISAIQMEKTINVHQLLPEYWPAKMRIMGKNLRHYILLVIFCQPSQFGVQVLLRGCSWLCKGSQVGSLWFVWNHFKSPGYGEGERWIYHRLSIQVVSVISQSYTIIRSSNSFPGESHAQKGRPTLGPWDPGSMGACPGGFSTSISVAFHFTWTVDEAKNAWSQWGEGSGPLPGPCPAPFPHENRNVMWKFLLICSNAK